MELIRGRLLSRPKKMQASKETGIPSENPGHPFSSSYSLQLGCLIVVCTQLQKQQWKMEVILLQNRNINNRLGLWLVAPYGHMLQLVEGKILGINTI